MIRQKYKYFFIFSLLYNTFTNIYFETVNKNNAVESKLIDTGCQSFIRDRHAKEFRAGGKFEPPWLTRYIKLPSEHREFGKGKERS